MLWFRTCCLASMHGTPVFTLEGGGHPLTAAQYAPQRGPTGAATGLILTLGELAANHLDELVSDDRDEQVAFGAPRCLVIDGA